MYMLLHHHILIISSSVFLVPILQFLRYNNHKYFQSLVQCGLVCMLLCNYIFSVLFWWDGRPNTIIHRIDAFLARLSIVSFSSYILFFRNLELRWKALFLLVLQQCFRMYYFGSKASALNWCSDAHIIWHLFFHLFVGIGATFAFI
jgi:hypothetical protein